MAHRPVSLDQLEAAANSPDVRQQIPPPGIPIVDDLEKSAPDNPEAVIKWIAGALVVYACILAYFAAPFVITFFASLA